MNNESQNIGRMTSKLVHTNTKNIIKMNLFVTNPVLNVKSPCSRQKVYRPNVPAKKESFVK